MNLQELRAQFRALAQDVEPPYFWSDEQVALWLSQAEQQACVRGRLLREDTDAGMCLLPLTPGRASYPLHRLAYEIIHAQIKPTGQARPRRLCLLTRELLDAEHPGWREDERPAWALVQDEGSVRVVGRIAAGDVLHLECYRLPWHELEQDGDEPEIHVAHHERLIQWALYQAFSVVDAETLDEKRAMRALAEFDRYFGLHPGRDLRRSTRHDVVHHTRPDFQWP